MGTGSEQKIQNLNIDLNNVCYSSLVHHGHGHGSRVSSLRSVILVQFTTVMVKALHGIPRLKMDVWKRDRKTPFYNISLFLHSLQDVEE